MATPQGMSRGSRDLGPRLEGAQEGVPGSIPPGFTYTQIESMVRELRTAAALEVNVKPLPIVLQHVSVCRASDS